MPKRSRLFGFVSLASSLDYTKLCIESFFEHTALTKNDRVILIDNDGSLDQEFYKQRYDALEIHVNEKPLCFAYNGNQLIGWALEENSDLYFLNNDLVFTPHWDTYQDSFDYRVPTITDIKVMIKFTNGF